MAKRTFYSFEKRQKEMRKQKKKEEKMEAKRLKREAKASGEGASDEIDPSELGSVEDLMPDLAPRQPEEPRDSS